MRKINIELLKSKFKRFSVGRLFYNNKFVMIFSVVASFITWIIVSSSSTESSPVTISDIPVTVQLSDSAIQDGLKIFSGQDEKAEINITGNRLIVGQVTKDDIQISAQQSAAAITSPGKYTLELTAKRASILTDYEFASPIKPSSFITVVVDRYREAEFDVETDIQFTANPELFVGTTVLSSPKVTLSGPEAEISKIKRVVAKGEIQNELQSTAYIKLPVMLYDAYGEQILSKTISSTVFEIQATIPVLKRKLVPVAVDFMNRPGDVSVSGDIVKITPSSLEVAGPKDVIDKLEIINLPAIDFHSIDLKKNKFNFPIDLPSGCKSLSNSYDAQVSINLQGYREKTMWITNFSFINVPSGKSASVYTGGMSVKFIGPSYKLSTLKDSDVTLEIDLMKKEESAGYMEIPASILIEGNNSVWAYGKYQANVKIQ